MKKTKFAMLLVMVLVFALQSVGMMPAGAEDATPAISVDDLSVDYIFNGLGDALTYGVVADEFYQMTHAETSVCVETLYKYADQPFMNTDKTYAVSQMRPIKASVSVLPTQGQTLNGTKYALFTVNGDTLEMCEGTVVEVNEDVDVTVLTWELEKDSPYRWENLCVRQVRGANNEIVEEGRVGNLTITYGPDISSAAPSSSYVGNIVSDQVRDTIKFHNTIDSDQPIELGSTRLVVKTVLSTWNRDRMDYDKKEQWRDVTDGSLALAYDWPMFWPAVREYEELVSTEVYVEYTVLNEVDSEGNPVIHRAKYSAFVEDGGAFDLKYERDDATGKVSFYFEQAGEKYYHTFTSTTGKATQLLQQARDFSTELAQLQGGQSVTNDINADPSLFGNSTVTSGLDANNRVVSVYSATITDGLIDFDASSEVLDKQIHIAPNEYVIVNVICDPNAESITVGSAGVAPPYIYAAGKQEQATWPGEPGSDTGSPDRVLYNFVTLGEDGKYKPYAGIIQTETQYYGGTFLAPEADIVTGNAVINGALIAKSVKNPQNELHQRTMLQAAQTTWVKMAGRWANGNGAIYLKKFDATTEQLLNGAVFGLFTDEAAAKAATMDNIDNKTTTGTTADGEFTFNNLKPGTYYVKELKAPAGYVLNNAVFTVEVQADSIAVVGLEFGGVPNNSENGVGWLVIDKVDAKDNNKKIANVVFEVYACEGDTFDADKALLADTITTDANGNAQSKLLNAGTYWVKETSTAFGYLTQETPVKVTITKEQVTYVGNSAGSEDKVSFTNEEAPTGTLSFVKQDADYPDIKLSGAKFAIYAENDVDLEKPLKTFETQWETGKVEETLPVGNYWIEEIQAPQNYTISFKPQLITITEGETTQIGTDGVVTNDYVSRQVKVGKVEIREETVTYPGGYVETRTVPYPLAGAWFAVYKDAACENMVGVPQQTDSDGFAYFTLRVNETYYVKEIAAPKGYVLTNATAKEFTLYAGEGVQKIEFNGENTYTGHENNGQYYGAIINAKAEETGTLKLFKNTWELNSDGLPADGTDNRENVVAIEGAVFGIYFDEDRKLPIEGSPFTTGKDGGITVSGLTPGKYWVKELEAAPGYLPNDDLLWVEVKAGDTDARVHWQDANGNDYRWVYNAVAAKPAEAQVEIEKTVDTEYSLPAGAEYTFKMECISGSAAGYQFVGDKNTTTVDFGNKTGDKQKTHGPDASFSPIKLTFTQAGTYVFTVSEVNDGVAGEMASTLYDPEVYTITYQVNKDKDGNLKLEPKDGTVVKSDGTPNHGALAFENAYKTVDITCNKIWQDQDDDRLRIDAGTFKSDYLELYVLKQDKDGTVVKDENGKEVLIPVTDDDLGKWKASFIIEPETGKAKEFRWYYHGLPGFDEYGNDALYVIKELTVTGYQTFYYNAGANNSYRPEATDALYPKTGPNATSNTIYNTLAKGSLEITKQVTGENAPKVDEFQFTITPDANTLAADGYTILDKDGKDDGIYTLTMDADGINGKLEVEFLFDDFRYDEKVSTTSQQKDAKGNVVSESKTFTFTVKEAGTAPAGWTYDTAEKKVTFTVTRNAQNYTVAVAPEKTTASFTNTYKEEAKTSVTARKYWYDKDGNFAQQYDVTNMLELYILTKDSDGKDVLTLVKDAEGNALRPDKRTESVLGQDEYTWSALPVLKYGEYVVKEDLVALCEKHPGYMVGYDYVRDDYANAEDGYIVMNSVFKAFAGFGARKLVDGKVPETAEGFSFVVENLTTGEKKTFKNVDWFEGKDNSLILVDIEYGPKDQPKPGKTTVYKYEMYEVDPGDGAYIYDKTRFKFQVTIDLTGKTTVKAWDEATGTYANEIKPDDNKPAVTFNNEIATSVTVSKFWFHKDNPNAASIDENVTEALTLYIKKADGSEVEVKDVDGKLLRPDTKQDVYVDNVKEHTKYTWNGLPILPDGDEYIVREDTSKLPYGYTVQYSNTALDYTTDEHGVYNSYFSAGASFVAVKRMDGKYATEEFEFQLVDKKTGNVLQTNKNIAAPALPDGTILQVPTSVSFALKYDGPEHMGKEYEYVIREVGGVEGYICDTTEYQVKVAVNADGTTTQYLWDETTQKYVELTVEDMLVNGKLAFNNRTATTVSVTKEWVGGKYDGTTEPVNLLLFADGVALNDKPTQNGNVYTWSGLPKYNEKGDLTVYTVLETNVPEGYKVTYLNEVGEDAGELVSGEKACDGGKIVNTYEEEDVYTATGSIVLKGTKTLEGRALKDGEFEFELYRVDAAGETFIEKVANKNGEFAFSEIKYTEKDADKTYTYKVYEVKGNLSGVSYVEEPVIVKVTVTDNGDGTLNVKADKTKDEIKFVNTYEAEGSVTFEGAKFLLGREFKQGDEFTFELLNEKGEVIDTVTINPTSGTKADFAFKTIKYELADAGKTYTYTYRVKEKAGDEDGMTYDDTVHNVTVKVSDAGNGTLKVEASNNADTLNFTNTYLAEGSVLFSGTKTMNGKTLVGKDFTFVLTDADNKEIETVTNDKDGKIVFSAIQYKLEDAGKTFTYKVYEKNDGKKSVTYDDTVYTVTVKVEDAGEGHLKVTASDNATKLNFTNSYEAKAVLTMNAYKTVNGYKPSVDQVYDFVLLGDDGTEMKAQNKDEVITFGTISFDEEDVGKTFIYTIKETTEANELLDVDTTLYQIAVTVSDNGDGNLKLETEILKDGKRANGVVFANTATATLAISKTVKGPGPDKAFDLKVTFIGVDGKELEGVYDYDGDVKGTITSGGVIALKDGQSVTIVGLPEGATYTVEENAGPAYTVTVNGKPIAKAEGTLVGHGKLEFVNTVEVTTFSVTKIWEGTDLGEITLTLYADGKQMTPQPEVTREGDKYTYYNLPKYNEEGEEIVYSAKERGIDGYIRIYNNVEPFQKVTGFVHDGGTIINREVEEEVHELSFKIRKVWTGVEATEEIPAITLTLYCNGEKMDVPTPKPDSEGWYRYYDLPKTVNGQIAVYTVVEEPIPGFTVTYKTASGEIVEEGVNGGEIVNAKIPQTGDPATLGLWLAMMGASAVLLTMLQRRRKA